MDDIKTEKNKLRKLLRKNKYQVRVVNTYTGFCWDNPQSKVFALFIGDTQLNPIYLNNLGFNTHFKTKSAQKGLFYDGVLGMSRAFNIVYNLSYWLFRDKVKGDAGYKLKYF